MAGRFDDIDDGLRDRARQLQTNAAVPFSMADGARIVDQIRTDARAAGMTPRNYVWHVARTSDVSSPHDGALFYAGSSPDDPGLKNRFVAEAWVERHNAAHPTEPVTTIEATPGGAQLDAMRLYDLRRTGHADKLGLDDGQEDDCWKTLSGRYAEQASGRTGAFATDMYPRAIIGNTEVPTLRINPNVGADRVEFAHEPPTTVRLPTGDVALQPHVRDVVGQPGYQARLQFHDRADRLNGYIDPVAANAMSKPDLQRHAERVCEQVDAKDRARAASVGPSAGTRAPTMTPTPPGPFSTPNPGSGHPTAPPGSAVTPATPHGITPAAPTSPATSTPPLHGALTPSTDADPSTTHDPDRSPTTPDPGNRSDPPAPASTPEEATGEAADATQPTTEEPAAGATTAAPSHDEPASTHEPTAEDQADQPTAEDQAADQPTAEERAATQEPAANEPTTQEPAATQPTAEEPAAEEPAAEESAAEESAANQLTTEQADATPEAEPTGGHGMLSTDDYENQHDAAVSQANDTTPAEADTQPAGDHSPQTADDYENQHDAAVSQANAADNADNAEDGASADDADAGVDDPDAGKG